MQYALDQLGFLPVSGQEDIYYVDMRSPVMLLQDVMLRIKKPHHDSDQIKEVAGPGPGCAGPWPTCFRGCWCSASTRKCSTRP